MPKYMFMARLEVSASVAGDPAAGERASAGREVAAARRREGLAGRAAGGPVRRGEGGGCAAVAGRVGNARLGCLDET